MPSAALQAMDNTNGSECILHDIPTPSGNQIDEILGGLQAQQKHVSPKYFYDDTGSRLFDQITSLKEYYPTRAEQSILDKHGAEISQYIHNNQVLLEPGSGTCNKIPYLLKHALPAIYAPIEISRQCLIDASKTLSEQFQELSIHAISADFTRLNTLPDCLQDHPKSAFFPGSTIGNFDPENARNLLANLHQLIGSGGYLLIGVDLLKPIQILHSAYNDRSGVTARFNLNLLKHIGRILETEFQLDHFTHRAGFNATAQRIEMHLACTHSHEMHIAGETIRFVKGETIHTENSYKYTVDQFEALAQKAGYRRLNTWCDSQNYFSFHCLQAL